MGREVLQCAKQINKENPTWEIAGFLDPNMDALIDKKCDVKIIGNDDTYVIRPEDEFVCAIGDTFLRKKVMRCMEAKGAKFVSLIHPTVQIADTAEIGKGVTVFANSIISDNTIVGDGCFVNYQCAIGHDVQIDEFCTIFANSVICGGCKLGKHVVMGTSSNVVPLIEIGDEAYVCAGSSVMRNVKKKMRVIGTPAGPFRIGGK